MEAPNDAESAGLRLEEKLCSLQRDCISQGWLTLQPSTPCTPRPNAIQLYCLPTSQKGTTEGLDLCSLELFRESACSFLGLLPLQCMGCMVHVQGEQGASLGQGLGTQAFLAPWPVAGISTTLPCLPRPLNLSTVLGNGCHMACSAHLRHCDFKH